jgi:diguanylate cyclase (GGDEF)-like protein
MPTRCERKCVSSRRLPAATTVNILIIEDDEAFSELIASTLEDEGYICHSVFSGGGALSWLASNSASLIMLDYTLPDMTGAVLIDRMWELGCTTPFIMVTGLDDTNLAVQMMRTGACDYMVKDTSFLNRLPMVVARALHEADTRERLRRAELSLRQSEKRLARAQNIARMGSWEWDLITGEVFLSDELYRILGINREEHGNIHLKWLFRHVNLNDRAALRKAFFESARHDRPFNISFRINSAADGEIVISSLGEIQNSDNGKVRLFSGTTLDITARIRAESEIQQLISYDSLTSLPNRNLLHDRLTLTIAQAHRDHHLVGILYLDLDRFKGINETLGHRVGDMLLQKIAGRLKGCIRESDTLARLGGDEFVVVLAGSADVESISATAKKFLAIICEPFFIDSHEIYTTASIGISVYPMDGEDSHSLLKHADLAMYQAKEYNANSFQFFSDEMNTRALHRMKLEITMRKAVEREEFFLLYQPQINANTGQVTGIEALLRWQHPELGVVAPDKFIYLAEETGFIVPIGEWVLQTACKQNKTWQDKGLPPVRIAVNLSARQFAQRGLDETIANILLESGLDPSWLELEITESTIMKNAENNISILTRLNEMGIDLAIDDFGTGYSSLSYLKHFPISRLKIDRSFVKDITTNPDDASIAEIIITMAKTLKLSVIAEGVETRAQVDFLAFHNCDEMQGYFFSKPVHPAELEQILRDGFKY